MMKKGKKNRDKAIKKEPVSFLNKRFNLIATGILIILGFIIYSNIFGNTTHFDDLLWLKKSAFKDFDLAGIFAINKFRFFTFLSIAINYQINGLNFSGYYLGNIIIHIINAILAYYLMLATFETPALKELPISKHKHFASLAIALIFIAHPLQTGAVDYIYQRLASLAATFYLASLLAYVKSRLITKKGLKKQSLFLLSGLLLIIGMFTKENTFTLPIAIIFYEFAFFNANIKNNTKLVAYIFAFIFVGAGLFFLFLGPEKVFITLTSDNGEQITSGNYLLTQFKVIPLYFKLLLLPIGQNVDHDIRLAHSFFDLAVAGGFILNVIVIAFGIYMFRRNRLIFFGIIWLYISMAVETGFVPIRDLMFEHRLYLPMLGFAMIIVSVGYDIMWKKNQAAFIGVFALLILVYSAAAHTRNKVWKDDYTLWSDAIEKSPKKARPYNGRGLVYLNSKLYDKALSDFNKSLEFYPDFEFALQNRGITYFEKGMYELAIKDYNKCISFNPLDKSIYNNRGNAYFMLKNYDSAIADYSVIIEQKPDFIYPVFNRGRSYLESRKYGRAIPDLKKALRLDPNFTDANLELAKAYYYLKSYRRANENLNKYMSRNPGNAEGNELKSKIAEQMSGRNIPASDTARPTGRLIEVMKK